MSCLTPLPVAPWVQSLDPRAATLSAVGFSFAIAFCNEWQSCLTGLIFSCIIVGVSGIGWNTLLRRISTAVVFILLIATSICISAFLTKNQPVPLALTQAGLIGMRACAMIIIFTVFLGTMDVITLGHTLSYFHLPDRMVHLFLFTTRYIEVLQHEEMERLLRAAKIRGFRLQNRLHTWKTLGTLIGALLVQSFNRAERIHQSMKLRGFQGKYYVLHESSWTLHDSIFVALTTLIIVAMAWIEIT